MNMDLYRAAADEHLREEFDKQRGVLSVMQSGLALAAEVLRCTVAGEPLPELPRALPAVDASGIEWLDWAVVSGGLILAAQPSAVPSLLDALAV